MGLARTLRALTLGQAKAQFPNRYTLEHMPDWLASAVPVRTAGISRFYAPQYRSDREWYENTVFPGEGGLDKRATYCESRNQTWPAGRWLAEPFRLDRTPIPSPGFEPEDYQEPDYRAAYQSTSTSDSP